MEYETDDEGRRLPVWKSYQGYLLFRKGVGKEIQVSANRLQYLHVWFRDRNTVVRCGHDVAECSILNLFAITQKNHTQLNN